MLLVYDLLLSKGGVALPATHGLRQAVTHHKARLTAELTKARLRRGFATLDELRAHVNSRSAEGQTSSSPGTHGPFRHPRWVRVNTLKTTLDQELNTTFATYSRAKCLEEITQPAATPGKLIFVDEHIPQLLAVFTSDDLTSTVAYKEGRIILQEKASCFPAHLLSSGIYDGKVIDACAAPGNKTTHLAAILGESATQNGKIHRVIACEKDPERSKTLEKMVKSAGAERVVSVRAKQNFLRLDPNAAEFSDVTALLLDPSCSGSGIIGRDEATVIIHLPTSLVKDTESKKRKRGKDLLQLSQEIQSAKSLVEETPDAEMQDDSKLKSRLENLSSFQLRLLQHAMAFPAAKWISYSTCSIHAEENEFVVVQALASTIACQRGWKILPRAAQVDGLRKWHRRGDENAAKRSLADVKVNAEMDDGIDPEEIADSCIGCEKGGKDGTMGFFVAGFIRSDESTNFDNIESFANGKKAIDISNDEADEEWNGFSDGEA